MQDNVVVSDKQCPIDKPVRLIRCSDCEEPPCDMEDNYCKLINTEELIYKLQDLLCEKNCCTCKKCKRCKIYTST